MKNLMLNAGRKLWKFTYIFRGVALLISIKIKCAFLAP